MALITIPKHKIPTKGPDTPAHSANTSEPDILAEPALARLATPDIATPKAIMSHTPVLRKRASGKRARQACVDPEVHAKTAQMSVGSKLEPFYTVADLAKRWKVSERHIRHLIDAGQFKIKRFGGAIRVSAAEVALYEAIAGM